MGIGREQILVQLERIVNSKTFAKTAINVKLLRFLVTASLEKKELKEATIGSEMFGKKYDPIKNDNKVRVYVYHLRKKLDQYYLDEAEDDEIVFDIKKGQYAVAFHRSLHESTTFWDSKKGIFWTSLVASILLLISIVYLVSFQPNKSKFWKDNQTSNYPTTVLIGDHYTLSAPIETGGSGIIRDFNINSETDFNKFIQKNPEKIAEITPNPYSYITKMGAYCSAAISQHFVKKGIDYDLMLNSEWDKSKITNANIVYIGQMKTMRFLKNILEEHYPFYTFRNHIIVRHDPLSGEETEYTDVSGEDLLDFTIVAKITGPTGNSQKLFVSNHDGGVISSLNYFINADSVKAFYSRHQIKGNDFIALFKVSGWERTGYNMELESIDFHQK